MSRLTSAVLGGFAVALLIPLAASAASVLWSNHANVYLVSGTMDSTWDVWLYGLAYPSVTVLYSGDVVDSSSGVSLADATVPVGKTFEVQFKPYQDTDISWNGTGESYDTPYGHWEPNAVPTSVSCNPAENVSVFNSDAWGTVYTYVTFDVNPPHQSVSVSDSSLVQCSPLNVQGAATCTATGPGVAQINLNFAQTYGQFFWRAQSSVSSCSSSLPNTWGSGSVSFNGPYTAMLQTDNPSSNLRSAEGVESFQFSIPTEQISIPITIIPSSNCASGNCPSNSGNGMTLSATPNGACAIGKPYSISMTATDPSGAQIKYGVDWDNSGSVEQFVPAVGYVPSGLTETAQRTYSVAGPETVRMMAEDQNGNSSPWQTVTFNCEPQNYTFIYCDDGSPAPNGDPSQCPPSGGSTYACENNECVLNTSGPYTSLTSCESACGEGSGSQPLATSIKVTPALVRSQGTTTISWSVSGGNVQSCWVLGSNDDFWTGESGSEISKPITSQTVYTLKCNASDGTPETLGSATVSITPTFEEE